MSFRILVTGSRDWTDSDAIAHALLEARDNAIGADHRCVVVHGGARGADLLAHYWAAKWGWITETHPATGDTDPKVRNQRMVDLGADVCLAFARQWASGTGHCARVARRAGIRTVDVGVDTRMEARP